MKKYNLLFIVLLTILFTSCLKDAIEEEEFFVDCDVTNVKFEHRWTIETFPGISQLYFKEMVVTKIIDSEHTTINVTISVPNADSNYPEEQRSATTLSNLACSFEVSRGASVEPLSGAPVLGTLGDYTSERQYRVTSASGKYKDWILKVVSFTK